MPLIIAAGCPASGWEVVLPALHQMGLKPAGEDVVSLLRSFSADNDLPHFHQAAASADALFTRVSEALREDPAAILLADSRNLALLDLWAEKFPESAFLLFYTSAEIALARAILDNQDLPRCIDAWRAGNQALLKFHRRHRSSALLFDAEAAVRHPRDMVSFCKERGIELNDPGTVYSSPLPPPLERLIAVHWLESHQDIKSLGSELEASAFPLGELPDLAPVPPQEVLNDYLKRQHQPNHKERRRGLPPKEDTAFQKLKAECEEIRHENDLLLSQLHHVQEEFETIFLQKRRLEQQKSNEKYLQTRVRWLERELEDRERQTAEIKRSTCWKFSAPIRLTARMLGRGEGQEIRQQVTMIRDSGLFDEAWYTERYPDVKNDGMDPVEHYLRHGAAEGRDPSPMFSTQTYLTFNPDVEDERMNPLLHYIQFGRAEKRRTSY